MKVLFISKGDLPDYQSDMILHGGRSVLGIDFVDANRAWYMYKEDKDLYWNSRVPENGKAYGRGFTITGRFLEDCVDRTNIKEKIESRYFDKVIYGSSTRCLDYIDIVVKNYNKKNILLVDGEDDQFIREDILKLGTYYKRELLSRDLYRANPICFAIPKECILDEVPKKIKEYATIIPGDLSTYVYEDQDSYYKGYQEAYFGVTFKKGGWDCLRHYEILANGCIPYFPDLRECPQHTMISFPKHIVLSCNDKLNAGILTEEDCKMYSKSLLSYSRNSITTENLFNYIVRENVNNQLMKNTYIFICSYNRLEPLKKLVDSLTSRGYNNIVILDNGSTYPPLLNWYKTLNSNIDVYWCASNYGPEALDCVRNYEPQFQEKYGHIVTHEYHVYTDGDVFPVEAVPENFIDDMIELAKKYNIPKLGLSLKIDDLPNEFILKQKVINHESSFFQREFIDDEKCRLFKAPVDTTFAVNSPGINCGYNDYAYRAAGNYFAKHAPWYFDSNNLPEDEKYYLQNIVGNRPHWSNELKSIINVNSNP